MFKFIHAADIHLDSPLHKLDVYDGAPVQQIRQATRAAFENLVNLAINQEVSFVLLSGDLYDGDWKDYNTGLYFVSQMRKLRNANIAVFIIAGNHDAASKITKHLNFRIKMSLFTVKALRHLRLKKTFPQIILTQNPAILISVCCIPASPAKKDMPHTRLAPSMA